MKFKLLSRELLIHVNLHVCTLVWYRFYVYVVHGKLLELLTTVK